MKVADDYYEKIEARVHRWIAGELRRAGSIVDVGCGDCKLACLLAGQRRRREVIGVDVSDKRFPEKGSFGGRLRCVKADARALHFLGNEVMDAVVLLYSLHEFAAPMACLRQARRLLRPWGEILVVDPARGTLAQRVWNERYLSTREVAAMLRRAGFVRVTARRAAQRQLTWATAFKPRPKGESR
jgi:ubiquinone/menaquinone biosynthesis C-methylase UbiE